MCPASGCGVLWPRALMISAYRVPIIPPRSKRMTRSGVSRYSVGCVVIMSVPLHLWCLFFRFCVRVDVYKAAARSGR